MTGDAKKIKAPGGIYPSEGPAGLGETGTGHPSMAGFLDFLSQADWLDAARLRRIATVFAILIAITLAADIWLHTRAGVTDLDGEQLGRDFVNYWAAGHLAAGGNAAQVYDIQGFLAWQRAHTAANANFKWFSYPPVTLLLCLPLAGLGFLAGYVLWLAAGALAGATLLARTLGWRQAWFAALAAPAAYVNAMSGQNGAFTAALAGGGVLLLESHPLVAGALFGGLCFKPQLAVLVPVALAAGGHWRAFLAAAAASLMLAAASALLFGVPAWTAFLHNAPINARLMEHGVNFWHRMPTVFAAARLAGAGVAASYGAQVVSTLGAALLVARVWRTGATLTLRGAVLIFATFLATPYAWDYDLVWLTLAVAWVAIEAARQGFRPWEKITLALTIVMPMALSPIGAHTPLQIGPLVLWAMAGLSARRALQSRPQRREEPQAVLGQVGG